MIALDQEAIHENALLLSTLSLIRAKNFIGQAENPPKLWNQQNAVREWEFLS